MPLEIIYVVLLDELIDTPSIIIYRAFSVFWLLIFCWAPYSNRGGRGEELCGIYS
jgi:hypothetical protein